MDFSEILSEVVAGKIRNKGLRHYLTLIIRQMRLSTETFRSSN